MFTKVEDTVINLKEIQSIEPSGHTIEITFINGKAINISTHKYDFIINGPGKITKAMYEDYDKRIEEWQKLTIKALYTSITLRG